MISKCSQIFGLQPQISNVLLIRTFFLAVGQNNFGNKIPFLILSTENKSDTFTFIYMAIGKL